MTIHTCSDVSRDTFGIICNDINSVACYCCQYSTYFDRHVKLCPSLRAFPPATPSNKPTAHIFKTIALEDGDFFSCEVMANFLHTKDVTSSKTVD